MPASKDKYGPFVLDQRLGGGAFGEVWEAHREGELVPIPVALKPLTGAETGREEFLQEDRVWVQVSRTRNPISVLAADHHPETHLFPLASERIRTEPPTP